MNEHVSKGDLIKVIWRANDLVYTLVCVLDVEYRDRILILTGVGCYPRSSVVTLLKGAAFSEEIFKTEVVSSFRYCIK